MPKRTTKKTIRVKSAETASVAPSTVAVIETGGKQYVVKEGQEISVEKLGEKENSKIDFKDMLSGKKVSAKVLSHFRTPKILVVKFKPKVRYLRKKGHRQWQTRLKIVSIKQ